MDRNQVEARLSDDQQAYAKNYLANQAESTERALDHEIHLDRNSLEINDEKTE